MRKHKQLNQTEKYFQQELQKAKEIQLGKFIVDQMSKNNPYFTAIEWNRHIGYLKVFFNKKENIEEKEMLKACVFLSRMLSFLQTSIQNNVISCSPITWYEKEQMLFNYERYKKSNESLSIGNGSNKWSFDIYKNKKNYMYIPNFDLPKFIHKYARGIIKV